MKLFCEACQRIGAAGSWSVIDGVLRVSCASCGVEAEVQPAGAAGPARVNVALAGAGLPLAETSAAAPVPAEVHAFPRPAPVDEIDRALADFVSMPTPGPAAARAARWDLEGASIAQQEASAALAVASAEETLEDDPWLAIGWAALQRSWNDPAAHKRLLAEASARGDFAGLGARYRVHLSTRPDDQVAIAARDELLKAATAQLFTRLPLESDGIGLTRARTVRNVMLFVFFLGLLAFAAWMLLNMGGGL